jgi:hypothetical protein
MRNLKFTFNKLTHTESALNWSQNVIITQIRNPESIKVNFITFLRNSFLFQLKTRYNLLFSVASDVPTLCF